MSRLSFRRQNQPTSRSSLRQNTSTRRVRRLARWRKRFPRFAFSSVNSNGIVSSIVRWFSETAESARLLRGASGSQIAGLGVGRSLRLESLERRELLAADLYVNDTWNIEFDADSSGTVTTGDTVMSDTGAGDAPVSGLTFGTNAFSTIQDAITAATSGNSIDVLTGSYNESVVVSGKDVSLQGAGATLVTLNGGPTSTPLTVNGGSDVALDGFTLTGGVFGIDLKGASSIAVTNSVITAGSAIGILVDGGSDLTVSDSTLSGAGLGSGVTVTSGTASISGSIINHRTDGVVIGADGGATLSNNDLSYSFGNKAIQANPAAGVIDASGNWWGTTDESVIAGKVLGNIDFSPFLASGTASGVGFAGDFSHVHVTALGSQTTGGRVSEAVGLIGDGALTGGDRVVNVLAGTYVDEVTVDRSLKLLGPNVAVAGNATRASEAVLLPATSGPDPFTSPAPVLVYVTANDVTVDGLSFDGDNPALTSGELFNGADLDATEAIASYEGVGGITVQNNIIRNFSYSGIDLYNYNNSGGATSGNLIAHNLIENLGGSFDWGIGIIVYNNFYADIVDNVINDVRVGVQTGNFRQANPGTTGSISGNEISARRRGIFYNLHTDDATPFTVENNLITAVDDPTAPVDAIWSGMLISSQNAAVEATFSNNQIDGSAATSFAATAGYSVWNTPTTGDLRISGGTVDGVGYGVWVNNFEGYSSNANDTDIIIDNVNIEASDIGVYVLDSPDNTNGSTVHASIINDTEITGAATGIKVEGADASADILDNDNSIHGNTVGIDVIGGSATITNNDIHHNTQFGVRMDNANVEINTSTIHDNGTGVRVEGTSTLAMNDGSVDDNTGNGLQVLGDGTYQSITVAGTSFSHNSTGKPVSAGFGDITLFDFASTTPSVASFTDVTVDSDNDDYAIQVRGSAGELTSGPLDPSTSANVNFDNVQILGTQGRFGMLLQQYADISGFSFNDVTFDSVAQSGLVIFDAAGSLDIGNTTFHDSYTAGAGTGNGTGSDIVTSLNNIDATGATFLDGSNVALDKTDLDDNFAIEDRVAHSVDGPTPVPGTAFVDWVGSGAYADAVFLTTESFIAPLSTTASVQRAVDVTDNAAGKDHLYIQAGNYVQDSQLVIDNDITVIGDPTGKPVITPGQDFTGNNAANAWMLVDAGVTFDLDNVVLDGGSNFVWQALRSHGNTTIDHVDFRNIQGSASGTPYRGNAIESYGGIVSGGAGSDTHGGLGDLASHLIVSHSTFENIGRIGVLVKGTGATADVSDNVYTGKGLGDWLDYAIEIGAGAKVDINNNNISDNLGTAVSDGSESAGVLVTTYYGAGSEAHFTGANDISGNTAGVTIGYDAADASVVTVYGGQFNNNTLAGISALGGSASLKVQNAIVTGNGTGISVDGAEAFVEDTDLTSNQVGIYVENDAVVDAGDGGNTSLGTSTGNNLLMGYTGAGGNYAIEDQNLDAAGNVDVYAKNNAFGSTVAAVIEQVVFHTVDDALNTEVFFTPAIAPPNTPTPPTTVYVDDDWAGTGTGVDADGAGGSLGDGQAFGYDQFATIEDALAAVTSAGTGQVLVYDGAYYTSGYLVDKSLSIKGESNAGVIVAPAGEDDNVDSTFGGTVQHGFIIQSSDVTIQGLTIDGEANSSLTAGKNNFRMGVVTDFRTPGTLGTLNNVVLDDITVSHTYRRAIQFYSNNGEASTGNAVTNSTIDDVELSGGIYAFESDVLIADNVISNVATAIGTNYISSSAYSGVATIRGNDISNAGLGMNLSGLADGSLIGGPTAADSNDIDLTQAGGGSDDIGILVQYATGVVTVQGNEITASDGDSAVWLYHNESTTERVDVLGNVLTSSSSDGTNRGEGTGIFLTDDGDFFGDEDGWGYATISGNTISDFARGVDVHGAGDSSTGVRSLIVSLSGNTITGSEIGVRVFEADGAADNGGDIGAASDGYAVEVTIDSNAASFHGNQIGIDVDGGSAAITSNAIYDNATGIRFTNAGTGSVGDNDFDNVDGNLTDLRIDATAGTVTIDDSNDFAGDAYYIDNQSAQDFDLVPLAATTYEGLLPGTLTDDFRIEDKMFHGPDNGTSGVISWVDDNLFVTTNGTGSNETIQNAIDAADSGDTVNVEDGAYDETLVINKSITLDGQTAGSVFLQADAASPLVQIAGTLATDNVTIRDFKFDGNHGVATSTGVRVGSGVTLDTLHIENSNFRDFSNYSVYVQGNATSGISAQNVEVVNSTFADNGGTGGGTGHISLFNYNGDALLQDLVMTSVLAVPGHSAIQLNGAGAMPIGDVTLDNVDISGHYRTQMIGLQQYSDLANLTFTDVAIGGAGSEITGGFGASLRFDDVGSGTLAAPATFDLGNTAFRGLDGTSAQPHEIEFAPDNNSSFLRIDGTNTVWSGVTAGSLTLPQAFDVEDRILHFVDKLNPTHGVAFGAYKGFVDIQANQAFITAQTDNGVVGNGSIQRGVDIVAVGGTVNVSDGTFKEQVDVTKNVTIAGQGATTILQAPGAFTPDNNFTYSGKTYESVLAIRNGAVANVQNLTVDGDGQGAAVVPGHDFVGIGVYNADATIYGVAVAGVRDTPLNGAQRGRAIFVGNDSGNAHTIDVANSSVSDYQKNAIDVRGADLTATITGNTLTGAGATPLIAQNGIVFLGGVAGTISGNTISDHEYTGPSDDSTGILLFANGGAAVDVTGNTLTNNQVGVYAYQSPVRVTGSNIISGSVKAGVDVDGGTALVENTDLNGNDIGVLIENDGIADLGQTGAGTDFTTLGVSAGGNDFSSYLTSSASTGAIVNLNTTGDYANAGPQGVTGPAYFDVTAFNNTFSGTFTTVGDIDNAIWHDTDDSNVGFVDYANLLNLTVSLDALPNTVTNESIDEGGSVTVNGEFTNVAQQHTVTITWGDGSANTVLNLAPGVFSFSATSPSATYTDDPDGSLQTVNNAITVVVAETAGSDSATDSSLSVDVDNVAPTVPLVDQDGDNTINEGETFNLVVGPRVDPGDDTISAYTIYWGDGDSTFVSGDALTSSSVHSHLYADGLANPSKTITIDVLDDDGTWSAAGSLAITVNNVDPTAANFQAFNTTVNEGGTTTVFFSAPFTDPGSVDTPFHFAYDFNGNGVYGESGELGDGTYGGSVTASSAAVPAVFLADGPGTRTVNARIIDNDGGFTQYSATINIDNVAPVVDASPNDTAFGGVSFTHSVSFTDPGTDAPWTVNVDWNGDGDFSDADEAAFGVSSHTFNISHTYSVGEIGNVYNVKVQVNDNDGGIDDDVFQVNVAEDTLRVTNFQQFASGFDATFNHVIDLTDLNLYDGNDTPVDLPDLSVVGSTLGTINGSITWDAGTNTLTWVKTGGVLQADTYTVTLESDNAAFKDTLGNLLDGDGDFDDNEVNDDYVNNFVVAASSDPVVSLPDFARGAGQDVNVPPIATGGLDLPISIDNATGVTAVDVDVVYDPNLLSITGASLGSGPASAGGWSITTNPVSPGLLKITISGTTALTGSNAELIRLDADVPASAPYADNQVIRLDNLKVNENAITAKADFAVHKAAYLGDADGDGAYLGNDAALISQVVVNLDSGFDAHDWTDPVIVADSTLNGALSGQDASNVAKEAALIDAPEIPMLPPGLGPLVAGTPGIDPQLSLPQAFAAPGDEVTIPVTIEVLPGEAADPTVLSATFDVFFNDASLALTPAEITQGSFWDAGDGWSLTKNVLGGQARLVFYNSAPSQIGTGDIAYLTFTLDSGLMPGDVVNLDIEPVDANEGNLTWTNVDGSIAVTFTADFEPDGDVDGDDLTLWQTGYGTSPATVQDGDADRDSDVDGSDFLAWQQQFGNSLSPAAAAATSPSSPAAANSPQPLAAASSEPQSSDSGNSDSLSGDAWITSLSLDDVAAGQADRSTLLDASFAELGANEHASNFETPSASKVGIDSDETILERGDGDTDLEDSYIESVDEAFEELWA